MGSCFARLFGKEQVNNLTKYTIRLEQRPISTIVIEDENAHDWLNTPSKVSSTGSSYNSVSSSARDSSDDGSMTFRDKMIEEELFNWL